MSPASGGAERRAPVYLALIAVQVMFASMGVAAKVVLRELPPRALIEVRSSLAALVFMIGWAVMGRERVARFDLVRIAGYAFFGITANQLLFMEGLERTTATNAVVLGATIPVFTVLVALVVRQERATALKAAGLAVALAGALTVTGVWRFEATAGGRRMLVGNLLVVANSLSFSIYLVLTRAVLARYRASTVIAFTFLFGALMVQPFGLGPLVRAAPAVDGATWAWVGYIVLFPSVGSYLLNAWALGRVEASQVAIFVFLQPVIGALLAAVSLGERPSVDTLAGGALILAGIHLVTTDARRRARARAAR